MNYNFLHNIEVILRDDILKYKAQNKNRKVLSQEYRNYHLFDFDNYFLMIHKNMKKLLRNN